VAITPSAGTNSQISTGGVAVVAAPAGTQGGYITNPASPSDQNLSGTEPLFVSPVSAPSLSANGTAIALNPGESFTIPPNSTLPVYVNAASNGHKFTVVVYN